jgi:hypothetical protein
MLIGLIGNNDVIKIKIKVYYHQTLKNYGKILLMTINTKNILFVEKKNGYYS